MIQTPFTARIAGVGSYIPDRVITNADLSKYVETSDEWIIPRTGIKERRYSEKHETTGYMAIEASKKAIADANIDPEEIDFIVLASVTPDRVFPATANYVQAQLGIHDAISFDLEAACSGMIYGLQMATGQVRSGLARNALVIGAERMTSIMDFTDRNVCVLFGDAAGALVIKGEQFEENKGILNFAGSSDGNMWNILFQDAGGSFKQPNLSTIAGREHFIAMAGQDTFKQAVRNMEGVVRAALAKSDTPPEAIDWFVPHQANIRIIESAYRRLGVPKEKVWVNIDRYGNTTSASILLCLNEMKEKGELKPGQQVVLFTFGAGLTWGACHLIW